MQDQPRVEEVVAVVAAGVALGFCALFLVIVATSFAVALFSAVILACAVVMLLRSEH